MGGCSILHCNKRSERLEDGISFHTFPSDPIMKQKWIDATGRVNWTPHKSAKICTIHFDENYLVRQDKRTQLKPGAIPVKNINTMNETMDLACKEKRKSEEILMRECRVCLQLFGPDVEFVSLFQAWDPEWDGMEATIAEDLAKLANIQLYYSDRFSKVICVECGDKLREACMFASVARNSDWVLRQRFVLLERDPTPALERIWPKPIEVNRNINGAIYNNNMDVEVKQEVFSDDEYDDTNGMDEDREDINMDIKIEPEEITEQKPQITVNGTITPEEFNGEIPIIPNVETSAIPNGETSAIPNGETSAIPNAETSTVLNGESSTIPNGDSENMVEEHLETPEIKEEPVSEEDEPTAGPSDLPLDCMLCSKSFNSISGLKVHVIAQHSYKSVKRKFDNKLTPEKKNQVYTCTTCRRRFATSTDLLVHETCHNQYSCYCCNDKFTTFAQLAKHKKNCKNKATTKSLVKTLEDVTRSNHIVTEIKQEKIYDEIELQCSQCDEKFTDAYYLNIHQEIYHLTNGNAGPVETKPVVMETETLESIFGINSERC